MRWLCGHSYVEVSRLVMTALLCAISLPCMHGAALQNRGFEPAQPESGRRLALVIGNADYPWKPLVNPINDAADVAAALSRVGFNDGHVLPVTNLNEHEMKRAVRDFVESIRPGDFAFVYYSGHGVEVKGTNYLLPIDIPADASEGEVEDEAVPAQRIASDLESQGAAVKVLVLDACRDNPLRATRSAGGGLVPMEGLGSLVIFATEAGHTASDNTEGRNGLFTQYLLKALSMRGIPLDDAVRDVARQMAAETNRRQIPAIYGLLERPVILINGPVIVNAPLAQPAPDPALEAWNLIKDSQKPQDFDDFANAYPNSPYATPARLRSNELKRETAEGGDHSAPSGNMGRIHGHVTNPTGQPQTSGTVSLSTDGGVTLNYTFPVSDTGDYSGEAPAGTYMAIYRAADTPAGKIADSFSSIAIVAGRDTVQNDDMSRQEFIDRLSPGQKKQLEDVKNANAATLGVNAVIGRLNADLRIVNQDKKDIDGAYATAAQILGASAAKSNLDAKVAEIRTAKYTEIENLMANDTSVRPNEALLWDNLAYGQAGLKKFDDAVSSYKKAIDLETTSTSPRMSILGAAQSGLGEVYARTGKVPEANGAYDAAAQADPANAVLYLKNEAIIFFQLGNGPAQVASADEALKLDPNQAILYYIKGQGLALNATVNPRTGRIVLPPDCAAAYQRYLELAPNGPYAAAVTRILQQAGD